MENKIKGDHFRFQQRQHAEVIIACHITDQQIFELSEIATKKDEKQAEIDDVQDLRDPHLPGLRAALLALETSHTALAVK